MLTGITGLPGAGKTLYLLSKIMPQYRGRDIYVYGIPAIDHEHFGTQDLESPEEWFKLPEGSVVIIDEAQKVFPLRRPGSQVPEKCSEFETHRHRGFDIVLLTQDATTLDVHIRKLMGKHVHVHRLFGGMSANIYEYGNYEAKPTDRNIRKSALAVKTWRYDKTIFDHYKSADIHTVKRQLPWKLIVLPLLALGFLTAIVWAFSAFKTLMTKDAEELIRGELGVQSSGSGSGASKNEVSTIQSVVADYALLHTPVVEGLPWTAPIYSNAMKVSTFPKPLCILHEKRQREVWRQMCTCYTQQVTLLPDVPFEMCEQYAQEGWFDFTKGDDRGRGRDRAEREPNPARSTPVEFQDDWPGGG